MANRIMLNETSYHGAGEIEEIVNEDDDTSDVEPTEPAELVDAVVVDEPSTSYEDRIKSKFQANYSELNGEAE